MKKNSFINFMFFAFLILFVSILKITALPNSIGPITQNGTANRNDEGCTETSCYGVPLKMYQSTSGFTLAICTDYNKDTPALTSATCNRIVDNSTGYNIWDNKVKAGVAAIITDAKMVGNFNINDVEHSYDGVNTSNVTVNYFAAEMAINRFLYDVYSKVNSNAIDGRPISDTTLSSTYRSRYIAFLMKAEEAYASYSDINVAISTNSIEFEKEGDNYVSNPIKFTITGIDTFDVEIIGVNNNYTVTKASSSFVITIPATAVTSETDIKAVVKSGTKTVSLAENYYCGSELQSLTPMELDLITLSDQDDVSGTITPEPEKAKLIINKFDNSNQYLAGAKIKVTGPNNYNNEFVTNTKSINLINLEFGTYTVEEIETPQGYVTAPKQTITLDKNNLEKTVTLINDRTKVKISKVDATGKTELPGATLEIQDKDGNIVEYCTDASGNKNTECRWISTDKPYEIEGLPVGIYYLVETIAPKGYALNKEKVQFEVKNVANTVSVVMKNTLNKIKISKVDATGKTELPGATLEIQDKDGNVVEYCTDDKGNTNTDCKWISADKPYEIEGLPVGKYYLVETIAPEGYALNKEKIEFEITNSGTVKTIKMKNELRKVRISKVNAVDKSELPGATLEIQDKDGNVVEFCNNKACKWVSTDEPYIIEGVPVGKYYLVETIAPEGYVLNEEKIEFEVKDDSTMVEVQMINDLEVEVPDTLSGRSALLLTIAMFDVALGIGILTYVKKSKKDNI